MPRTSKSPWIAPSSPGRPCSRLSAASGFAAPSAAATLRSTSIRVTRKPCRSSASAQAFPERSDTSRSADHPPISTATCWVMAFPSPQTLNVPSPFVGRDRVCPSGGAGRCKWQPMRPSSRYPDALDLPLELHARMLPHPAPHVLAQGLDVGRARMAAVDQEIAVHLRYLGVADHEPAAAGSVNELPSLLPRRILECRAARAALDRLGRLARLSDLVHLGSDRVAIPRPTLQQCRGEDQVFGRAAMAIGVMHLPIGKHALVSLPIHA